MFNEHLILKALCHIIWDWHLLVECLVNFMLCACSSSSDLSLYSASQSLSISKSQSSNSAQILKSTEISWNIFGNSGLSSEVPELLRKFQTFSRISGHLRKFRTLNFSTKFLVTLSFLSLPKLPFC